MNNHFFNRIFLTVGMEEWNIGNILGIIIFPLKILKSGKEEWNFGNKRNLGTDHFFKYLF